MTDLSRSQPAEFDANDHCISEGWATWMDRPMRRFRVRCWFGRHAWPWRIPYPRNGHSPTNYDRCCRCRAGIHWYVIGQHRYGSYGRDVAKAYGLVTDD